MDTFNSFNVFCLCFILLSCGSKTYSEVADTSDSEEVVGLSAEEVVGESLNLLLGDSVNPPGNGYMVGGPNRMGLQVAATEDATWLFGAVRFPSREASFFVGAGSAEIEIARNITASQQHFLSKYDSAGALIWGYGVTVHTDQALNEVLNGVDDVLGVNQMLPTRTGIYLIGSAPADAVVQWGNTTFDFTECASSTCGYILNLDGAGKLLWKKVLTAEGSSGFSLVSSADGGLWIARTVDKNDQFVLDGTTYTGYSGSGAALVKLNNQGQVAQTLYVISDDLPIALSDINGRLVITGRFNRVPEVYASDGSMVSVSQVTSRFTLDYRSISMFQLDIATAATSLPEPSLFTDVVAFEVAENRKLQFITRFSSELNEISIGENCPSSVRLSTLGIRSAGGLTDFFLSAAINGIQCGGTLETVQGDTHLTAPLTGNPPGVIVRTTATGDLVSVLPLKVPGSSRGGYGYVFTALDNAAMSMWCTGGFQCAVFDENALFQKDIELTTIKSWGVVNPLMRHPTSGFVPTIATSILFNELFAGNHYLSIQNTLGASQAGDMLSLHPNPLLVRYAGGGDLDWVAAAGTSMTKMMLVGDQIVNVFDAIGETFQVGIRSQHHSISVRDDEMKLFIVRLNGDTGAPAAVMSAARIAPMASLDFSQTGNCPADILLPPEIAAPACGKSISHRITDELWKLAIDQLGVGDWQLTESTIHLCSYNEGCTVKGTFTTLDGMYGSFLKTDASSSGSGLDGSTATKKSLHMNVVNNRCRQWTKFAIESASGQETMMGGMMHKSYKTTDAFWVGNISSRFPANGTVTWRKDSSSDSSVGGNSNESVTINECEYSPHLSSIPDYYDTVVKTLSLSGHEYRVSNDLLFPRFRDDRWWYSVDGVCQYQMDDATFQKVGECPTP